jgi:hypothetical protein
MATGLPGGGNMPCSIYHSLEQRFIIITANGYVLVTLPNKTPKPHLPPPFKNKLTSYRRALSVVLCIFGKRIIKENSLYKQ